MVSIMFHTPRKSLRRDQATKSGPGGETRSRRRSGKDGARAEAQRETFVDPVHGRHCICTRCAQHRAA
jgi:hypothetical protein